MVEIKVNGNDYKETIKTTEQINTLTTKSLVARVPSNCSTSVLLSRNEEQVVDGEKNGQTSGHIRYGSNGIMFN